MLTARSAKSMIVLILVLMEDTLRVMIVLWKNVLLKVLILVLMEDTLRVNNLIKGRISSMS